MTMKKYMIDHKQRARHAWPILVKLAKSGSAPITYGELSAQLALHHRAAGYFLGVIQAYCKKERLPKLQALVVNKATRVPGSGYEGSAIASEHKRDVTKVHAYGMRWPRNAPF